MHIIWILGKVCVWWLIRCDQGVLLVTASECKFMTSSAPYPHGSSTTETVYRCEVEKGRIRGGAWGSEPWIRSWRIVGFDTVKKKIGRVQSVLEIHQWRPAWLELSSSSSVVRPMGRGGLCGGCEGGVYEFINTLGLVSELFSSQRVDYLPKQLTTLSQIK